MSRSLVFLEKVTTNDFHDRGLGSNVPAALPNGLPSFFGQWQLLFGINPALRSLINILRKLAGNSASNHPTLRRYCFHHFAINGIGLRLTGERSFLEPVQLDGSRPLNPGSLFTDRKLIVVGQPTKPQVVSTAL